MTTATATTELLQDRRAPVAPAPQPDFEALLGAAAWGRLPAAVRRRFEAHRVGEAVVYEGVMVVRASLAGRFLAQACRLIGTPLAPWTGDAVAVSVTVRLEADGGLVWDRVYRFEGRAPVLVSSAKRAGRTGELLETAGVLGMRSVVSEDGGALHFRGRGYLLFWRGLKLAVPLLLTPGEAHVVHEDLGGGRFRFGLRFVHPWLGETFFQEGVFADPA